MCLVFRAVCSQLPALPNWHDSRLTLALGAQQSHSKWRLSVPTADEVNYGHTTLIRRCHHWPILERFMIPRKKTLFYVPLHQDSEGFTVMGRVRRQSQILHQHITQCIPDVSLSFLLPKGKNLMMFFVWRRPLNKTAGGWDQGFLVVKSFHFPPISSMGSKGHGQEANRA